MRSALPSAALALAASLLVAGCGGAKSYTLADTKACLAKQRGVRLYRGHDFVASTALGGALYVKVRRANQLVISFGLDEQEAERIARAYRRFRGRNIGIEDVLRPQRNAVLLWKAHPSPADESTVTGCLK